MIVCFFIESHFLTDTMWHVPQDHKNYILIFDHFQGLFKTVQIIKSAAYTLSLCRRADGGERVLKQQNVDDVICERFLRLFDRCAHIPVINIFIYISQKNCAILHLIHFQFIRLDFRMLNSTVQCVGSRIFTIYVDFSNYIFRNIIFGCF